MTVTSGLTALLAEPGRYLGPGPVGLVANATTVTADLQHAVDLLHAHPDVALDRLFAPEHGIRGAAEYMAEVADERDPATGLPVHSLYGRTFASLTPRPEQLAGLSTLVFDIQDVGSRYYTFAATMALCMRACGAAGVRVVVLDRPNPIGGLAVEGGGLTPGLENFCGLFPVPQRHGMTVGELARLYRDAFGVACELTVVPCANLTRAMWFGDCGLPWVMPSPQMPTPDTALVYPGMCLLEGTEVSEGRGTTRPFELFGAPYVDAAALVRALAGLRLPGVIFRPCAFTPTFDKFAGELCHGAQIHVRDRAAYAPYRTGLAIVWALQQLYPESFAWRVRRYEFRSDVPAFDLLTGTEAVRRAIAGGAPLAAVEAAAAFGTGDFGSRRQAALLYR